MSVKSLPYMIILTAVHLAHSNAQNFGANCELLDPFGQITPQSCLTEPQDLLRARDVVKTETVQPANSTCGQEPSQYCRLVSRVNHSMT